jgi:4'-phosphopantetheinyl transferase EntD
VSDEDKLLAAALKCIAPAGVLIGHRTITDGDEHALSTAEAAGFSTSTLKVRRQSGAARMAARELLGDLGYDKLSLPRKASGIPSWPPKIVGSMAHDDDIAVAAIARTDQFAALGIDIEPAQEIDRDLVTIVTTSSERRRYNSAILTSRLFFVIKEATYKALNPTDGRFLDFHDMEVDLCKKVCTTSSGKRVHFAYVTLPRVVALSFIFLGHEG